MYTASITEFVGVCSGLPEERQTSIARESEQHWTTCEQRKGSVLDSGDWRWVIGFTSMAVSTREGTGT